MAILRILSMVLSVAISAIAWGDPVAFLTDPWMGTWAAITFIGGVAGAVSGFNLSHGIKEIRRQQLVVIATVPCWLLLGYGLPWARRRALYTFPTPPWLLVVFLALNIVGAALRVWPMFLMGRRFSGFVTIQEGHALCTEGPYRIVRHPSYLGAIVWYLGTIGVFASIPGLLIAPPLLIGAIVWRIADEERLLADHFGQEYIDYTRRCPYRLLPYLW